MLKRAGIMTLILSAAALLQPMTALAQDGYRRDHDRSGYVQQYRDRDDRWHHRDRWRDRDHWREHEWREHERRERRMWWGGYYSSRPNYYYGSGGSYYGTPDPYCPR
jgi:hypothetical protein